MIDRDELGAWLRLLETPLLGRNSARRLLAAFGSPERVLAAPAAALREVIGAQKAALLQKPPPAFAALVGKTLAWLGAQERAPRGIVALGDPRYPAALLGTDDPPLLLYTLGHCELLNAATIAIVGSRNPTPQGAENAHAFASHLSRAGLTVASGLALGIDAAAHAGALEGPAGTIAAVGTGLDIVYPRRNAALAQHVAAAGLLVSEYAIGTPAMAANFPRRNRIIAGLARGTLVVEAALRSGSLITARLANEAGREVFAIPGSIHAPQARGCHALIKQGAKLVETADDILEELRLPYASVSSATPSSSGEAGEGERFLTALGHEPVTLDALAARTGSSAADLAARLFTLELDGQVARLPGQLYQRVVRPLT